MKSKMLILILLMTSFFELSARIDFDTVKVRLNTPRNTIITHYKYLESESYLPSIAFKGLNTSRLDRQKGIELAIKLKKIFSGRALVMNYNSHPNEPDYFDTITGRAVYYPFREYQDIYLEKIGNKWLYSEETVANIPAIYSQLYPLDLRQYVERLPVFFTSEFLFGMQVWQIICLLILLSLTLVTSKIIKIFLIWVFRISVRKAKINEFFEMFIKPIVAGASAVISLIAAYNFLPIIELPLNVNVFFKYVYKIILLVLLVVISFRVINFVFEKLHVLARERKNKLQENLIPFFRSVFKFVVLIIGTIAALLSLGIDIIPLLAGLSIGGLAIALAAQETIKNIFGSLTIFADRPFDVGDWIIYEDHQGIVQKIGIRSTTIRTFNDSLITVPNGKLMDLTIDNMGKREFRKYETYLDLVYNTPIELMQAFVEGIRRIILEHPLTRKDQCLVFFAGFEASSLQIYVRTWFAVPDIESEYRARDEILFKILDLGRNIGIEFAYPTQTLHIEEFPEKEGIRTEFKINNEELKQRLEKYFDK